MYIYTCVPPTYICAGENPRASALRTAVLCTSRNPATRCMERAAVCRLEARGGGLPMPTAAAPRAGGTSASPRLTANGWMTAAGKCKKKIKNKKIKIKRAPASLRGRVEMRENARLLDCTDFSDDLPANTYVARSDGSCYKSKMQPRRHPAVIYTNWD